MKYRRTTSSLVISNRKESKISTLALSGPKTYGIYKFFGLATRH